MSSDFCCQQIYVWFSEHIQSICVAGEYTFVPCLGKKKRCWSQCPEVMDVWMIFHEFNNKKWNSTKEIRWLYLASHLPVRNSIIFHFTVRIDSKEGLDSKKKWLEIETSVVYELLEMIFSLSFEQHLIFPCQLYEKETFKVPSNVANRVLFGNAKFRRTDC